MYLGTKLFSKYNVKNVLMPLFGHGLLYKDSILIMMKLNLVTYPLYMIYTCHSDLFL